MPNITIHNVQQGTPEWLELRRGKIGGSSAHTLLTEPRSKTAKEAGELSEALKSLAYKNAAAIQFGEEEPSFSNFAMERGSMLEEDARILYELETGISITQVGYISAGQYFGVSPDGLNESEGIGIEIKCPLGPEFLRYKHSQDIKKEHYAQCQWLMYLHAGINRVDYVVYHPEAALIITPVFRDEEIMERFSIMCFRYSDFMNQITHD